MHAPEMETLHQTWARDIHPGRALIVITDFIVTLLGFRMVMAEHGTGTRQ